MQLLQDVVVRRRLPWDRPSARGDTVKGVVSSEKVQHPERLRGRPALRFHVGLTLCLIICIPAFVFELSRALGGNSLSWAYVFEWPLFAGFGFYMWWKLLHEGSEDAKRRTRLQAAAESPSSREDAIRLDAWNTYLAQLHRESEDDPNGPPSRR